MRDPFSIHRYLPAIVAVILSIWYAQSFYDTASPIPIDAVVDTGPVTLSTGLSLPETPRTAFSSIGPIKDDRDDDAAWKAARHGIAIERTQPSQDSPAAFIPLPPAPAVASNAFRLFQVYLATQRFRL